MGSCQHTGAADVQLMTQDGTSITSSADILFPNSSTLKSKQTRRMKESMRGTSSAHEDDNVADVVEVDGTIAADLGQHELDLWLPRAMGADEASDVFNVGEDLNEFMVLQKIGTICREFGGCIVNQMTISGESRGDLGFALDIIGKTVTEKTLSEFDTAFGAATKPSSAQERSIQFCDGSMVFDSGAALPINSFNVVINNNRSRAYYASKTPQCLEREGLREVNANFVLANDTASETLIGEGGTGATAVLSFITGTNQEFTIVLNGLKWEDEDPTATSKGKLTININAKAHAIGDADTPAKQEIYITNDLTG